MKKKIRPHSHIGWNFSILNTDKYFLEKYKIPIISAKFTHCAVAENLDDLKEIFNEIQDYEYINETLFSKTRHVLTLNQPEFVNLYQLNIKHRKVNPIQNAYIKIENVTLDKLNIELFVLNTGGNHKPSKKQYNILKFIMKERYPTPTKFEIINKNKKYIYKLRIISKEFLKIFIGLSLQIIFISIKYMKNINKFLYI